MKKVVSVSYDAVYTSNFIETIKNTVIKTY